MTHAKKMLLSLLVSLALCAGANAVVADSSATAYQSIVDRNVFGLKPPPPPPDPEATKPPPPKITLTGITTIFGNKRALMKATPPPKPPDPAKEQTYMLTEGQRDGDIEVLEIDEKANTVKVRNYGVEQTLNFDKDGVKLSSTIPGGAPVPGPGGIPAPASANPFAAPGGFNKAIPTRSLRLPVPGATGTPGAMAAPGTTGASAEAGGVALPGFGSASAQAQPAGSGLTTIGGFPTSTGLSPEENVILYEANRLKNAEAVKAGRLPRMPAHPMAAGLLGTPSPSQAPQ